MAKYVEELELREEIKRAQELKIKELEKLELKYKRLYEEHKLNNKKIEELEISYNEELNVINLKTFASDRLGEIVWLTAERIGRMPRFRYYTYIDDMIAEGVFHGLRGIIKFKLDRIGKDGKPTSAFSYLTQIITNAFRQILNKEKKAREIKDSLIEIEQMENENFDIDFESIRKLRGE